MKRATQASEVNSEVAPSTRKRIYSLVSYKVYRICCHVFMNTLSLTLKLPFYRLNQAKAIEFERLTSINTEVANNLMEIDRKERKKLTSADFKHIEIGSVWIDQTIRNTNTKTKVRHFKRIWLEVNNQGFEIIKSGELYTLSFSLYRGKKGRIPLSVHPASHTEILDKIIRKNAKLGSLKLCKSKKGIWYALVSVSMEVPDAIQVTSWMGIDRGQNNIAVAALRGGFGQFWKGGKVKNLRRRYQRIRKSLQRAKQLKEVKRLEQHEKRVMTYVNHVISKQLVKLASDYGMGLRLEDLSGCRQTMKQRTKTKSDAANNRDSWAFYQLGQFIIYKALRLGIPVEFVPAPYTSKSDHRNGVIGKRNGDWFKGFDGYRCNADWNASQNIGQWLGFSCPLNLQKTMSVMGMADAEGGVNDSPLN
jgi:putative transposase